MSTYWDLLHLVVQAKILVQKLWQCKITWDEPLDEDLQAQWRNIANDLKSTARYSVSRYYFDACMTHPVVHCLLMQANMHMEP